jgi:outer membrane protein assembly factor BamB
MIVDGLDAVTGERRWRHAYTTDYEDRYGYNGGPRAMPLLEKLEGKERVYTLDPKGILLCLDLKDGKTVWQHDLQTEFHLEKNFFGVGAAPLIEGDRLIVNLGGTDPGSGLALAIDTGAVAWKAKTGGGAYAVPAAATIDGARHVFVFHRGGLSCLDPADGRERWIFPWRSRTYESVNASTPIVVGDQLLFTATYGTGGVALRVKKDAYDLLWKDDLQAREKILESHWCTPIHRDGYVYAFSGRHEPGSTLNCVELATGRVVWRWESYLGRGSLLYSDGHFILLGERGDLALFKLSPRPDGHEELRRVRGILHYPSWTPPTLSGGILYLRDERGLMALDLRPPEGR